jgi:hypothetical protein
MAVERWVPAPWTVAVLIAAGADPDVARLLVDQAVTVHGVTWRTLGRAFLPLELAAGLRWAVGRMVAGETLENLDDEM